MPLSRAKKKKKIQGYSWEQRNRRNFIKAKTGNVSSWRAREGDVLGQRSSWEKEEARNHPVGLEKDKPLLLSLCVCRDHHGADHVHHHHGRERLHAPRVLHQGRGHLPLGQLRVCVPLGAGVRGRQLPDHRAGAEGAEAAGEGERSFIHFLVGVHAAGWMRIAGSGEKGDVCAKGGGSISEYSSFYHNGSQKVASLWTKTRKTWVLDLSSATSFGPQFPHLF